MESIVIETDWLGERIRTFRDLIPPHPRALFVGLNPSPVSLARGHYHQGILGQRMWRRLENAGIIPSPPPRGFHDELLGEIGIGITDLVKRPSRRSDCLTPADFAHGRSRLLALLDRLRPRLVCFIYKKAAEEALGRRLSPGAGLIGEHLCRAPLFLFPGPYAGDAAARSILRQLRLMLIPPQS